MPDLIYGNNRFTSKINRKLLEELSAKGQKPEAIIISCSDSRVPVEIVFDVLVPGKLFVVRVAGNVVSGPIVIGSIEYAIRQLKVPHIVLLGHTGCGAVKASIDGVFESETVEQLCKLIRYKSKDLDQAVVENLEHQFNNLLKIECVKRGIREGSLEAYAMVYDLQSGRVNIHNRTFNIQTRTAAERNACHNDL